jgi:hypothetical protein
MGFPVSNRKTHTPPLFQFETGIIILHPYSTFPKPASNHPMFQLAKTSKNKHIVAVRQ